MSNKYDPPQTRVEAILLNMLGESYKLDPPQTRVELLLQAILEQGGGGGTEPVIKYKGVTTTPLTDGSTTNPVEIDGEEVTVATGDFVAYNGAEFIWNGTSWQELGDLELVAAIMTSIAPTYSESETYNIGDRVYYNDILYECLDNNVTGSFVPSKWTQISVVQILSEIETSVDQVSADTQSVMSMISDTYKTTSTYNIGDLVIRNKVLFSCTTNNTTGTWDASKWSETDIATVLKSIRSSIDSLITALANLIDDTTTASDKVWSSSKTDSEIIRTLSGLTDTEITSPTDKQILRYDEPSSKWINSDEASVTKTATGNPIEFSDAASAPLVKCVTQITGSQDLHGYDKPWVGGAGKNKWNEDYTGISSDIIYKAIYVGDGTFTMSTTAPPQQGAASLFFLSGNVSSGASTTNNGVSLGTPRTITSIDGYVTVAYRAFSSEYSPENYETQVESGSTATAYTPYSNICPITAYTEGEIEVRGKNLFDKNANDVAVGYYLVVSTGVLTPSQSGYNTSGYIPIEPNTYYTKSGASVSADEYCFYDSAKTFISGLSRTDTTVLSPNNAAYMRFDYKASETDDIQIEKGSSATAYEPYTSTTHTTTYPTSIYRGSEDVVNGEVTAEWGYSKGGTRGAIDSSRKLYKIADINDSEFTQAGDVANMISSHFPVLSLEGARAANYPSICKYGVTAYVGGFVGNETALDALLPDLEIAYKLATHTTESITPTNLPIKSLSGYNHIESSTGEMEVEYITQTYQPLVDLITSSAQTYREVTAQEYEDLPDSKNSDNVLYFVN